ncbi:MAG: SRPBCC family protein [Actinomycetota bacterium]|nr:SRPBCC family protein [Actinomycetota bacterium]MDP3630679.1 SRPBCC family protein [Actinomycetota bacterium]
MRARGSIVIAREPEAVFQFVSDPAKDTSWRSFVTASHASDGAVAVGSRVRQTYSYQGRTADLEVEVTEYAPPERIGFRTHGQLRARINYTCVPEAGGTRFNMSLAADIPGPAALFEARIQREADGAIAGDLKRLKAALEQSERS